VNFFKRQRDAASQMDEQWQPRVYIRLIILALVIAYVIAFILENGKSVKVKFVVHSTSVSLIWVILLSIALGAIGGILLSQLERRRRRRRAGE
jgi:uncharacterized integral membrane protein